MKITVAPDIERALTERARKQGTTPETLAVNALRERFVSPEGGGPAPGHDGSLAEFLGGHVGVLASSDHVPGGARMSESCGRRFAEAMVRKREQAKA